MSGLPSERVTAYLSSLPHGTASHPECRVKGSVLREITATNPERERMLEVVPADVGALLLNPPPVSSWISEVRVTLLIAARIDVVFRGDEAAFEREVRAANARMLAGPLYRALFFLVTPERLMRHAPQRWRALRQGTELSVEDVRPGRARLVLHTPPRHVPPFIARIRTATFESVLEVAGAKDPRVVLSSHGETELVFEGSWR